ncbi:MAG: DNA-directed RNA polymerase subunit alpha [Nitrospiraceae bacterium]|nr:DNA-directed RNA polymerase subunit alpha [Nitrospiraceae bacterium]
MDLKKKGFVLPEKIRFEDETLTDTYGKLIAEPLERGYGATLGNSLRRILLSSLEGAAVSAVRIRGAVHEFSSLDGVQEDVMNIVLNLKKLRFVQHGDGTKTATISMKGPGTVRGTDLNPGADIEVLTPDQAIANLDKGAVFEAEVFIRKSKGYVPSEMNRDENLPVDAIPVDSAFSPITKVNFWVEKARVGRSTDYDRLILELWTDGSVNPEKAVSQAALIMTEHLNFFVLEKEDDDEHKEPRAVSFAGGDEPIFNESLMRSVEELELSVRAQNCLKNANIKTIGELVQKTEHDMLKTKNFGRKSLNEIKDILGTMGLRFGMKVDTEALQRLGGGHAA